MRMVIETTRGTRILRRERARRLATRANRDGFAPVCGNTTRSVRFAGSAVADSCPDPLCSHSTCDEVVKGDRRSVGQEGAEGQLRGLLLQAEPAVRTRLRRTVSDVPPRSSRRAAAPGADALRLPAGAPAPGRVGPADRTGAGRTPHVVCR